MKTEKNSSRKYLLYLSNLLIIGGIIYLIILFFPIISLEIQYQLNKWKQVEYQIEIPTASFSATPLEKETVSPQLHQPVSIIPASTEFGLIIEKINLNSTVQPDIDITTKSGYWTALENGVAHAKGTKYPGQRGNSYLFAHSTVDPLEINKYNAVFTLLYKLEEGDRIVAFYQGSRFDYYVDQKEIVESTNTEPLTRDYDEPVLTLQTCHPPGTDLKRLIITTRMKNSEINL